ncbi:RsbRD N-terminal domain-containing protein [Desulfobacula phenolica]|uniref:RsbT co-antagonist protein rsbRD N-terminal domain-containing protein n=1 Tax=Desulfobacula phenolica TaxID=90732 RepID=A0A1H2HJK2_9BACT|nr:RsbRD N-terminal domain-containing protein [Desulfobacula phenolica]SDU31929.1 RsbT co-antagonist protein rsbRD N-terminal domain-containing protein [Desulfobacula phenolica]
MHLKQILEKNKKSFTEKWFQATIDTYPAQSAKFLGKDSNRFDNPVGAVTHETIEDVINLIIGDFNQETLEKALDPIIRIRAVQSFSASEAVSFVFALKQIGETILDNSLIREFDKLVDQIALASFNKLMKCKEEVFLLKATESKRRIHRAFERAGLVAELTEEDLLGSKKS